MKHTYVKIFGGHYKGGCVDYWYTGWINLKIEYYKFQIHKWFTLKRYSLKIFLIKLSDTI